MSLPKLKIVDDWVARRSPPGPSLSRQSLPSHPTDPITAWLDTLSMVLKLPRDEREGVRDELAGHLRDRVRDLMLSGASETQAAQTALSELGDAVNLAQRLRAASRTPARRMAMNLTVLGVAGAALVTSMVALRGGGSGGPEVPVGVTASAMPQPVASMPDDLQKIRLTIDETATWSSFFKLVGEKSKLPVDVRWRLLEPLGYTQNNPIKVSFRDTTLTQAIKFINEEVATAGADIDYRVLDGRLTFATRDYFDQQETVLVAYDLSKQVADRAEQADGMQMGEAAANVTHDVRNVLCRMVHPDGWEDNGGSMATVAVYGSKLFIKAPKRYHTEIKWVIDELPKQPDHADAAQDNFYFGGGRRAHVDADVSVPMLHDIPILGGEFKSTTPVAPVVGQGPVTVSAENGGHVEVAGPQGTMKADKVHITTEPSKPEPVKDPTSPAGASPAPQPPRR